MIMRFLRSSCLFLAISATLVSGFSTSMAKHSQKIPIGERSRTTKHRAISAFTLWSSAPSDSASDEPDFSEFGYGSSTSAPTEEEVSASVAESLVNKVLSTLPSDFGEVSPTIQATVNEILYTLEALNPTKSPALSPLVNGVWELRYSGGYTDDFALPSPTRQFALFLYSGGYSPGLFCYRLAQTLPKQIFSSESPLVITIRRDQPRVEASLSAKLFNGAVDSSVTVQARLEAESSMRLRETYEKVMVMGREQTIPAQLQYARDLYITYVDEDLLVVRDASGVPEVLVRQEKSFQRNWGVEPSAISDMGPPGDGEDAQF